MTPEAGAKPERILVFGGKGFIGQNIRARYPQAVSASADIADRAAVARALDEAQPQIVINCAGKTGRPNVDWCEDHKEETLRGNVTGALVVLEECMARGLYLVHFSSGCIYEGDNNGKGWSEDDPPNYKGSFYSRSKAWSDQILGEFPALVVRMRMPFDGTQSERSLIMKIRKYRRVLTEANSITYLPDFMGVLASLIVKRATGIYNIVNEGLISPHEIMVMYRQIVDPAHSFEPLSLEHMGEVTRAGRSNCLLSTAKLRALGLQLSPVREAVDKALRELAGQMHTHPSKED